MKKLLVGLIILLGLAGPSLAQTTQDNLTGKECWSAGPGAPICSNLVRNTHAIVAYQVTGDVTFGVPGMPAAPLASGGYAMITAQPASATVTLPPNPFPDGGLIAICNASGITWTGAVVTIAPNTGQTAPTGAAANLSAIAPHQCVKFIFYRATSTWYRVT